MAGHSLANSQICCNLIGAPLLDPAKQKRSPILLGKFAQSPRKQRQLLGRVHLLIRTRGFDLLFRQVS
jgi:hypothetical protein